MVAYTVAGGPPELVRFYSDSMGGEFSRSAFWGWSLIIAKLGVFG